MVKMLELASSKILGVYESHIITSITMIIDYLTVVIVLVAIAPYVNPTPSPFFYEYSSYGGQLHQAMHYFHNITSDFNVENYGHDFRECYKRVDKRKIVKCWGDVNGRYRSQVSKRSFAFTTYKDNPERMVLDCQYSLEPQHFKHLAELQTVEYAFIIHQQRCATNVNITKGGTTFEVFGYNSLLLPACTYIDSFDSKYHAVCHFTYSHIPQRFYSAITTPAPDDSEGSKALRINCLALTVVVVHEYFETYSEQLGDWNGNYLLLYPRTVIADNRTVCFPSSTKQQHTMLNHRDDNAWSLPANVTLYTASWHSKQIHSPEELSMNIFEQFGKGLFHSSYDYHTLQNIELNTLQSQLEKDAALRKTIPALALAPPVTSSDHFVYDIVEFRGRNSTSTSSSSSSSSGGVDTDAHIAGQRVDLAKAANATLPNDVFIHVIGASHSRYLFNALVEHQYGPSIFGGEWRHHGDYTHKQLAFHYQEQVDDAVDVFATVCAANTLKKKFVFHVGHWDLTSSGLRHYLLDAFGLPKVFGYIEGLFGGGLPCPGLQELVYVLTVPYPMCYDDVSMPACNFHRSYRFNPSIAASNMFMLRYLTKLKTQAKFANSPVELTIVDAYSMIHPRLLFNEDTETACMNHFLCRVELWARMGNMTFAPGGKALFDTVLTALIN